jgi:AcrR family transcriptional regulator
MTVSSRLGSSAWVAAAMDVIASKGIDGVRVETLARRLHVTKGSFYWHFRDRRHLCDAVLNDWRRRATLGIIERLEGTREPPGDRLRRLLRLQFDAESAGRMAHVELAIRLWGRTDKKALRVLREVDALRLKYIAGLFEEMQFDTSDARARALVAYSYMRISRGLIKSDDTTLMKRCEQVLSGRSRAHRR